MGSDAVERFYRVQSSQRPVAFAGELFVQSVSDIDDGDDRSAAMRALMHGID